MYQVRVPVKAYDEFSPWNWLLAGLEGTRSYTEDICSLAVVQGPTALTTSCLITADLGFMCTLLNLSNVLDYKGRLGIFVSPLS
jgi:hypothetical protein